MKAQNVPWFLLFALGVILAIYATFLVIANPDARVPPPTELTTSTPDRAPSP